MAASWSAIEFDGEPPKGTTVGLTVDFLAAARAQDLLAEARVLRRGASLCFCEVKATGAGDGKLLATGLVTYSSASRRACPRRGTR
jgi:acyl-coenzyme A thioesterase PaaI-like protein